MPASGDRQRHAHQRQFQRSVLGCSRLSCFRSRLAHGSFSGDTRCGKRGLQPGAKLVVPAEDVRDADPASRHRANRQHDQRERHGRRCVMKVRIRDPCPCDGPCSVRAHDAARCGCLVPSLTVEREEDQPEHVRRGQERRQRTDRPQQRVPFNEGLEQDLVLAEESGQRGHAGNRNRADQERPVRDRQFLPEAAHVPDVLLAVQRVNHCAGTEEEQRLEERMRVEMEDAGAERADAHRQEHVAKLRDRRIREHALDVVLDQADRARHQRRQRPDDGDDRQRLRRVAEQHRVAPDHVDAGRHHRRRVDERRDGSRAFHGVRQPGVERNLR